MKKRIDWILVFYFLFFLPKIAYAYIDPGSITVLLQMVVAVSAGVLLAFRQKVVQFFRKLFGTGHQESSEE